MQHSRAVPREEIDLDEIEIASTHDMGEIQLRARVKHDYARLREQAAQ